MKKALSVLLAAFVLLTSLSLPALAETAPPAIGSFEEMLAFIRAGLLAREETIRFVYTGADYREPTIEELCADSDDPAAGDYLRLSFNGAFPENTRAADGICTVSASYYTTAAEEAAVDAFVRDFAAAEGDNLPDARKAWLAFDWLCRNVTFELEDLYSEEDQLKYTAYGAAQGGSAVCQGFAQLFYRLARELGLSCRIVTGLRANELHAWNVVKLNGQWFHVDAAAGSQLADPTPFFLQPLFENYLIVYGYYTAEEIETYPFALSPYGVRYASGTLSKTVTWTFDNFTTVLEITGSGEIPENAFSSSNLLRQTRTVEIGEGITGVGASAFTNAQNLRAVAFPRSLTAFDATAFSYCPALETLTVAEGNETYHSAGNCVIETGTGTLALGCKGSVIPGDGSVTSIGRFAFQGAEITEITLPEGVTSIGEAAFTDCKALKSVAFPSSFTSSLISFSFTDGGTYFSPFGGCSALERITVAAGNEKYHSAGNCLIETATGTLALGCKTSVIPTDGSVTYVGRCAFSGNEELTEIVIPDGVTGIDWGAFKDCTNLTEITAPDSLTFIERNAMENTTWWDLQPEGMVYLGNFAYKFKGNSYPSSITFRDGTTAINCRFFESSGSENLKSVTIPGSVHTVVANPFDYCRGLNDLILKNGVTEIKGFFNCSTLTRVVIPESVTTIADGAFSLEKTPSLTIYGVAGSCAEEYATANNIPFANPCTEDYPLHRAAVAAATQATCTEAGYSAGRYCVDCGVWLSGHKQTAQALGHKVVTVNQNQVNATCYAAGSYDVVRRCSRCGLVFSSTHKTTPQLEHTDANGDGICDNCNNRYYGSLNEQISWTFDKPTGRLVVSGSGDVPANAYQQFQNANICDQIRSVVLTDGITGVGDSAFRDCKNLTAASLPISLTTVGSYAFYNCDSLQEIAIPAGVTAIGSYAFFGCSSMTAALITASVTEIGASAFSGCSSLTELTLPSNLTKIGANAFSGCSGLTEVTIPANVTEIGAYAFSGCSGLTEVAIPANVTEIGAAVFSGCSGLTRLTVAAGNEVYYDKDNCVIERATQTLVVGCKNSVIPADGSVTKIGESAFHGCSGLTAITIPNGVTTIGDSAFSGCDGLPEITLPDSVITIGKAAFSGCKGLTAVGIPAAVTSIGENPFRNCPELTVLTVAEGNPAYHADGNCLIETQSGTLIFGCSASVIPADDSVTAIAPYAFYGSELQTVTVPNNVAYIGAYAFSCCTELTKIVLPEGLTKIYDHLFADCSKLTDVTIPDSVTKIGASAFSSCSSLCELTIPDGVTTIASYAFFACKNLRTIYLSANVVFNSFTLLTLFGLGAKSPVQTVYGVAGSSAEEFARKKGARFVVACPVTKRDHKIVTRAAVSVSCTEDGYTVGSQCTECGAWISGHTRTGSALGHAPAPAAQENWTEPTCTAVGFYDNVIRCTRCGEAISSARVNLPMLPHVDADRNGLCDACGLLVCEHEETAKLNERPASCTEDGYSGDVVCAICGATMGYGSAIPAAGHSPTAGKPAVPATCIKKGSTEEVVCAVCGTVLTASAGTPLVGHTDDNGDGVCDVCRAPVDCAVYGVCGEAQTWYVADGILVISGSGESYDLTDAAPWDAYTAEFDAVYVKAGVTAVTGAAFNGCTAATRIYLPADAAAPGCDKTVLTYSETEGAFLLSSADGPVEMETHEILNAAYVLCLDHSVTALRFASLRLLAPSGRDVTEYDVLLNGKYYSAQHYSLPSGAVVSDFRIAPCGYESFNAANAALNAHPEKNLVLQIVCPDLVPEELQPNADAVTEQLVLRFVDEPLPPETEDAPLTPFERIHATLAAILALIKKLFKLFSK